MRSAFQDRTLAAVDLQDQVAGLDLAAVAGEDGHLQLRVHLVQDEGEDLDAGDDAGFLGPQFGPRRPVQAGQGVGGDVFVDPVLFQRQADDFLQAAMLEVHGAIIGASSQNSKAGDSA